MSIRYFIHGKIFTSDPAQPEADVMAVRDGKVLFIGKEDQMSIPAGAEVFDLGGRRVIPGFCDVHMHPVMLANDRQKIMVMPPKVRSIRELILAIREKRRSGKAGEWIEGWGYDEQGLAEKRAPLRQDLDEGCADSPVFMMRTCAHIVSVNSLALKMAGIDRNTPDPPGGHIDRDDSGEPTGVLRETARNLVTKLLPQPSEKEQAENLLSLGRTLSAQGITTICDMGRLGPGDNFPILLSAAEAGFRQKTGAYYMWDYFAEDPAFCLPEGKTDRSRQIFAAGLKVIADGSISGCTAWMAEPYLSGGCGISVMSDEELFSAIDFCRKNHCQLAVHAMGTRAIERVLKSVSGYEPWTPSGVPHVRIEHVTEPSERSIEKLAAHGIPVVTQPVFLYAESKSYVKNLGPDRIRRTYPIRHMLEKGVTVAFSTDAPATFWADPTDPFRGLALAVTRVSADGTDCGRDQAIGIRTAVELYTREAARAAGMPGCGMLAPGYRADFAVLNQDLFAVPAEQFDRMKVDETWIGGENVYIRD